MPVLLPTVTQPAVNVCLFGSLRMSDVGFAVQVTWNTMGYLVMTSVHMQRIAACVLLYKHWCSEPVGLASLMQWS